MTRPPAFDSSDLWPVPDVDVPAHLADADDVTRFRAYVARSLAPTGLVLQVAECPDDVLAAVFAQLPKAPDAIRFQLVLDSVRWGFAPFHAARQRVASIEAEATLERWLGPWLAAVTAGTLDARPSRTRAADVCRRLPMHATRALVGSVWPAPGCSRPDGLQGDVVVDDHGVTRYVSTDGAQLQGGPA